MTKLTVSLILALLILPTASAQTLQQQHARMRSALDNGDTAAAEQALRNIWQSNPQAFALNNYDYLLGRLLEKRGANSEAVVEFQKVIGRGSPLGGYAVRHIAEIMRAQGNSQEEARILQTFVTRYTDNLMREAAIGRLSEIYFKTGQYQSVINTLRLLSGPRRDAMAMIGRAQVEMRQNDSARLSFEAVLMNGAMDDASLQAVTGLDRIEGTSLMPLSEADRLRRARVYQFNRHFAEARKHWLAFIKDFPQSQKRSEALFQLGRGLFLEDKFVEAARWYDRAHDEFPQSDDGEQGFYFAGHCYQWVNDADRAIARYEQFIREYPNSEYVGYAHLNAIDTLRTAGRLEEALRWAARAQTNIREHFIQVTGLFNQAKIRLTQGNYSGALSDLSSLKMRNLGVRGLSATTNAAEVAYLRGYCLERLGRFEEAVNEYLGLMELRGGPAGYYGRRASERLRELGNNARVRSLINTRKNQFLSDARSANYAGNAGAAKTSANQALRFEIDAATRDEMLKILRESYGKLRGYQLPAYSLATVERNAPITNAAISAPGASHQTIAAELLFLGLYDEGGPELAETPAPAQTIAYYCAQGECAHRSIKYSEPILNTLPEDYRPELMPREWSLVFYPMPFRDELRRFATPRNVDPRFVLSIMRQESRYDPRVKSNAAARGMLQFIASTANQIAAQLKIEDFEQSDLYNPEVAILFGSQYMKNLYDEFGSWQAVAAAYNGGEDSVRRWRARARSAEVDRLVIETLKSQTKDYVFKVMNNLAAYQQIYPVDRRMPE